MGCTQAGEIRRASQVITWGIWACELGIWRTAECLFNGLRSPRGAGSSSVMTFSREGEKKRPVNLAADQRNSEEKGLWRERGGKQREGGMALALQVPKCTRVYKAFMKMQTVASSSWTIPEGLGSSLLVFEHFPWSIFSQLLVYVLANHFMSL